MGQWACCVFKGIVCFGGVAGLALSGGLGFDGAGDGFGVRSIISMVYVSHGG